MKQINTFIGMVFCVAVDFKSDSRQGNLKQEELIKTKNIEISSRYRMSECVVLIASAKIPAGKRCVTGCTYKTLCLTPPPLLHRRLKHF